MMAKLKQSWFVGSLLFCLILVNGFLAVPAIVHADHHAKHEAGTHSTGLCAWQCVAGQTSEDVAPLSLHVVTMTSFVYHPEFSAFYKPFVVVSASRGPPAPLSAD